MSAEYGLDVGELRRAFDRTFTEPKLAEPPQDVELVALRLEGELYALHTDEIAGIIRSPRFAPVPSPRAALLGLGTVRGAIVAWYDLGRLMGRNTSGRQVRRWGVLSRRQRRLGLAFDALDGLVRVVPDAIHESAESGSATRSPMVSIDGSTRPLLSMARLLDSVTRAPREHEEGKDER